MDNNLRQTAMQILESAPCSIEMPAGTGKTQLVAAAATLASANGNRTLILTHTNAGVHAIRARLKKFDVPTNMVHVDTITSWAFSLVNAYSTIAGIAVPEVPDWSASDDYVQGATLVAKAVAVAKVHAVSFDFLFVDEYQDCTVLQHDFVLALSAAIPQTVILGDRFQAIFGFAGPLASWDQHVTPSFPQFDMACVPHRWAGHNPDLGHWLLEVRSQLVDGQAFDFAGFSVPGLRWQQQIDGTTVSSIARGFKNFGETVVLIDKWSRDVARHASRLGGVYSVMEEIQGNFMRTHLAQLPAEGDFALAGWLAGFAKECIVGLGGIDQPVLTRLRTNQSITHYTRQGIELVLSSLDALRLSPSYEQLVISAREIRTMPQLRIYRWEAWHDTFEAISMTTENGAPVVENLGRVRERLRHGGRRSDARVASRTLLVKGLEYDHVVIADNSKIRDPNNLYVALTRARKSITVIGRTSAVILQND